MAASPRAEPVADPPELALFVPGADRAAELARISAQSFAEPWSEEGFAVELGRGRTRVLAAREGARLVGYALGWRAEDELELLQLAVAVEARGRGIGARLLAAYLDALRAEGVARVLLEVRPSNSPALRLYARSGARALGRRRRYYADGEDALVFALEPA